MNLNTQMDAVPSQTISQSLQHKIEDNMIIDNYENSASILKDDNVSMNVENLAQSQNVNENYSITSVNMGVSLEF
jgi:hypothetical protein